MGSNGNQVRLRLAMIPVGVGIALCAFGLLFDMQYPGTCVYSQAPPSGTACPSIPIDYALVYTFLGIGAALTVLGLFFIVRTIPLFRKSAVS